MARMIDADVAIKRFRGWLESPHGENVYHSGYDDAIWHILDVIEHMPTLIQPNEPLTLEELREMDGQPVWVEDVKHWALIDIGKGGQWDGVPFAIWAENGVRFCYNVIDRNLICYRRPPEGEEETHEAKKL